MLDGGFMGISIWSLNYELPIFDYLIHIESYDLLKNRRFDCGH